MPSIYELAGSGSTDKNNQRQYQRKWLVNTGTFSASPPDAWSLVPVVRYDFYPDDLGALAVSASAEATDDLGWYEVTVDYESSPFEAGSSDGPDSGGSSSPGGSQTADPSTRVPVIKFGTKNGSKILVEDKTLPDNKKVVNSAKQPFDPPVEVDWATQTITITKYLPISADIRAKQEQFTNTVNKEPFPLFTGQTPYSARKLKCNSYDATSQFENGVWFWEVTVELEYNPDTWDIKVLDMGTCTHTEGSVGLGTTHKWVPIRDEEGNPLTTPVPLFNGQRLETGDPKVLTFKGYNETFFDTLFS